MGVDVTTSKHGCHRSRNVRNVCVGACGSCLPKNVRVVKHFEDLPFLVGTRYMKQLLV